MENKYIVANYNTYKIEDNKLVQIDNDTPYMRVLFVAEEDCSALTPIGELELSKGDMLIYIDPSFETDTKYAVIKATEDLLTKLENIKIASKERSEQNKTKNCETI